MNEVVNLINKLKADKSYRQISRYLNTHNIQTSRIKKWTHVSVGKYWHNNKNQLTETPVVSEFTNIPKIEIKPDNNELFKVIVHTKNLTNDQKLNILRELV
jgi:hypothetical protein